MTLLLKAAPPAPHIVSQPAGFPVPDITKCCLYTPYDVLPSHTSHFIFSGTGLEKRDGRKEKRPKENVA